MKKQAKGIFTLWVPVIASIIVPGSGYVLLGMPFRGLQMLFFMAFLGYITFNLTGPDISPVGRFAGGFAVWVLSVLEVSRIAKMQLAKRQH